MESHFPTEISTWLGKILEIRELQVVAERVLFLRVSNLRINSQRAEKTLRAKVIPREENTCWISTTISLLSSILPRTVDELPVSVFDDLGVPGKLAMSSSECHKSHEKLSLGLWDTTPRTEAAEMFFHDGKSFSDWDSGLTGEDLGNPRVARCSWTCPLF